MANTDALDPGSQDPLDPNARRNSLLNGLVAARAGFTEPPAASGGNVLDAGLTEPPPGVQSPDAVDRNAVLSNAIPGAVQSPDAANRNAATAFNPQTQQKAPTPANVIQQVLDTRRAATPAPTATPALVTTPAAVAAPAPVHAPGTNEGRPKDTAGGPPPNTTAPANTTGPAPTTIPNSQAIATLTTAAQQLTSLGQSLGPNSSSDAQALFAQQAQGILALIQQQEDSLRSSAEKAGQTIDTSTQFALDKLKQNLSAHLQQTQEDLNRRGLFQSGILLDLEQKLRSGEGSEEARILGTRLDDIRKSLTAGLQHLGDLRVRTASDFGMKGAEAEVTDRRDTAARRQQLIMEIARVQAQEEARRANEAAQERSRQANEAFQERQRQANEAFQGEQNKSKFDYEGRQGDLNRQNAITLENLRLSRGGAGGGGVTNANLGSRVAGGQVAFNDEAHSAAQNALRDNYDLTDPQGAAAAAAFIKQNAATIAKNGADPNALLRDIQGDLFGASGEWNTGPYGRR